MFSSLDLPGLSNESKLLATICFPGTPEDPPPGFPDDDKWWKDIKCGDATITWSPIVILEQALLILSKDCSGTCDPSGACYNVANCTAFHACWNNHIKDAWWAYNNIIDGIKNCCAQHPNGGSELQECINDVVNYWQPIMLNYFDQAIACCHACN